LVTVYVRVAIHQELKQSVWDVYCGESQASSRLKCHFDDLA
jgi:hypothetical protein